MRNYYYYGQQSAVSCVGHSKQVTSDVDVLENREIGPAGHIIRLVYVGVDPGCKRGRDVGGEVSPCRAAGKTDL